MPSKGLCIIQDFGQKAKTTAGIAGFTFMVVYRAEGFHYDPETQQVPTFVKLQWSAELPSHIAATGPNTATPNYVVLPPPR